MSSEKMITLPEHVRQIANDYPNKPKFAEDAGVSSETLYRFIRSENINLDNFEKIMGQAFRVAKRHNRRTLSGFGPVVLTDEHAIPVSEKMAAIVEMLKDDEHMKAIEAILKLKTEEAK